MDDDDEIDVDEEINADIQKGLLAAKKAFDEVVFDKGNWDIHLGNRLEVVWFYEGETGPKIHKRFIYEEGMDG